MIAALLKAGVKAFSKGSKKVDYAKVADKVKPADKAKGVTKADMPAKSKPGSIRSSKEELNKRKNELAKQGKADSPTYKKMLEKGVDKQAKRTKMEMRSKKPGMSKGYKTRKRLQEELSNAKRQMMDQGHNKELAQKIGNLQEQIDNSYGS